MKILYLYLSIVLTITTCFANDITKQVFSNLKDGIIAAFGDFNSDELTDVFVIKDNFKTLEILLGADTEPLLRSGHKCKFKNEIVSVVPGDFDGDALMDVLVTLKSYNNDKQLNVYINWGGTDKLDCSDDSGPALLKTTGEPMAIDFNGDMIIDLFGLDEKNLRTFWIFGTERKVDSIKHQSTPPDNRYESLKIPHSNAFIDLNMDYKADLYLQTEKNFEIWTGRIPEKDDFEFYKLIKLDPAGNYEFIIGQSVFLDMELRGENDLIIPVCFDKNCNNSSILIYDQETFRDLHVGFKDTQGALWSFVTPKPDEPYSKVITARSGDFNMDGYPDLLVTLTLQANSARTQTFLLENVPCKVCNKRKSRTFEVQWNALAAMANYNTVAGAFFDFYQDGILDVILIEKNGSKYRPLAFRNTLDYDANFVKVIVLTGLINKYNSTAITPLGRKKRTYGTNLPGPRIVYYTTTQEGDDQHGASAQIPQSAYHALQLPYTIFGLGRTPNFVDTLTVGLGNKSRTWTQLIPNSQMFVIPRPNDDPQRWKAQLFVTPSKLILMSVVALGATCLIIMFIILGLHVKEKREDKKERLMEANRFHFDAM